MQVGASTSCFYPLETELSLQKVTDLGFDRAEVFFNSVSELEDGFVDDLLRRAQAGGTKIVSVHPFSSSMENNCIFGEYQRRYDDYIGLYRQHCHAAARLGADIVVIHGAIAKPKRPLPAEHYFDRFASLVEIGKQEGVMVCQENVVRFRSQSLDFLRDMRAYLGDDFHMVFDVKQSVRCGYDPFEVVEEMKNDIVHIHLSDHGAMGDCLPPGKGDFDFKRLFSVMRDAGYSGNYVTELYSLGYDMEKELVGVKQFFDNMTI